MTKLSITEIVKNNVVRFYRYRQGVAYYLIELFENAQLNKYIFPVPIHDVGDATLYAEEKAITYMRYIRKAIAEKTFVPPYG